MLDEAYPEGPGQPGIFGELSPNLKHSVSAYRLPKSLLGNPLCPHRDAEIRPNPLTRFSEVLAGSSGVVA